MNINIVFRSMTDPDFNYEMNLKDAEICPNIGDKISHPDKPITSFFVCKKYIDFDPRHKGAFVIIHAYELTYDQIKENFPYYLIFP